MYNYFCEREGVGEKEGEGGYIISLSAAAMNLLFFHTGSWRSSYNGHCRYSKRLEGF